MSRILSYSDKPSRLPLLVRPFVAVWHGIGQCARRSGALRLLLITVLALVVLQCSYNVLDMMRQRAKGAYIPGRDRLLARR